MRSTIVGLFLFGALLVFVALRFGAFWPEFDSPALRQAALDADEEADDAGEDVDEADVALEPVRFSSNDDLNYMLS